MSSRYYVTHNNKCLSDIVQFNVEQTCQKICGAGSFSFKILNDYSIELTNINGKPRQANGDSLAQLSRGLNLKDIYNQLEAGTSSGSAANLLKGILDTTNTVDPGFITGILIHLGCVEKRS